MTETATEQTEFSVGQTLDSDNIYHTPLHTVVVGETGNTYRRVDGNAYICTSVSRANSNRVVGDRCTGLSGHALTVESLPGTVAAYQPIISTEQLQQCPVGTTFRARPGDNTWVIEEEENGERVLVATTGQGLRNTLTTVRTDAYIIIESLPDGFTLAEGNDESQFEVGMTITSTAMFPILPVGTVIRSRGGTSYIKAENDYTWTGGRVPYSAFTVQQRHVILSLPASDSEVPEGCAPVGEGVETQAQMDACPIGTVLQAPGYQMVRISETEWRKEDTEFDHDNLFHAGLSLNGYNTVVSYPTVERHAGLAVGDRITSRAQLDALPVGTVIRGRHPEERKIDGNVWAYGEGLHRQTRAAGSFSFNNTTSYRYYVVSFPGTEPAGIDWATVGTEFGYDDMPAMPVGTLFKYVQYDSVYEKVNDDGYEDTATTTVYTQRNYSGTRNRFVVLGRGTPRPDPTLRQYKARFRALAYGAAFANGVSREPLDRIMSTLGVPQEEIVPGMVAHAADYEMLQRMPRGTVIQIGRTPASFATYGLTEINQHHEAQHILGGAGWSAEGVVLSVPGVAQPAWAVEVGTERDAEQIAQFKSEAWRLGVAAKSDNSWCGVFEATMRQLGIDASSVLPGNTDEF